MNWARAGQSVTPLTGEVNGTSCTIIPDTEADITVVPGHLVYASQLLEEFETVRSVSCAPVCVQCAEVPITFEGKEYEEGGHCLERVG